MATTRYIVLTNGVTGRDFARKERAVAEAEGFVAVAREGRISAQVQVATTGGKVVFDETITAPAPVRAPRPAKAGKGLRAALGEAAVSGWELLYDKPRQNAQVGRKDGQYALICTTHKTVHPVARLVDERTARKAGGWCSHCDH